MAFAFNKFDSFIGALGQKKIDLSADTLKIALTNVAPVSTNSTYANLTEIAAGGGYLAGGISVPGQTWTGSGGTWTLKIPDATFTATGSVASFRYAVLYDSTATNKDLIGWYDRGTSNAMVTNDTLTFNFDDVNGVLSNG